MNVSKLFLFLILGILQFTDIKAQIVGVFPDAVALNENPGNCIWLSNQSADQIKVHYLQNSKFKPEKVVAVADKTSKGYRMYYKHQGSMGWQKYWIKVTTINTKDCIGYYEDYNPDLLLAPFKGLKSLVGTFGHTSSDYKKIYKQYQHVACRLYTQTADDKGYIADQMTMLLSKYTKETELQEPDLIASEGKGFAAPAKAEATIDHWNHWVSFLEELDKKGFVTLIEYSACPL
jgi:hypothetical protein